MGMATSAAWVTAPIPCFEVRMVRTLRSSATTRLTAGQVFHICDVNWNDARI
jgi:hypothetical protein